MKKRESAFAPLLAALQTVSERLVTCGICGNVDTHDPCAICADPRRDPRSLCVVEEVSDLWALDKSRLFPGKYHVLGGRLSALEGIRPQDRSEEHTSELQSLMRISYAVFCLNKKTTKTIHTSE